MDITAFGQQVAKQRLKKGMSQEALAFAAGISPTTLKSIECGKSSPRVTTAQRIAKALGCPLSVLIGESFDVTELITLLRKLLAVLVAPES